MPSLAIHQRILLKLIRGRQPEATDDAYFHRVARSPDLREARGNIFLWRVYVLERTCVLTVALLRRLGRLEEAVDAFMGRHNVSPFREFQPLDFLASLRDDADPLVVSVAAFERAWMKVREGDRGHYEVNWHVDPRGVLKSLADGSPLLEHLRDGSHVVRVSAELPGGFEVAPAAALVKAA